MKKVRLPDILQGKVVIAGIGNSLRADDGLGPALVQRLKGKTDAICFDVGSAPENFTGKIVQEKPDTILLVDALHLEQPAGQYAILTKEEILNSGFTTHDISPKMLIEYLEQQTQAKIYMLGVQPQNLTLGAPMSEPVQKTLENLTQLISQCTKPI